MNNGNNKGREFNQGIVVLFALGILTALEFFIAQTFDSTTSLAAIALIKAGIIVQYYMHVDRVGGSSEEGH